MLPLDNSRVNTQPIWWEVRPVLVKDQADWPAADGSSGITSSKAMDDAEAAGRAVEVGSNFFLFFSSEMSSHSAHMHAKPSGVGPQLSDQNAVRTDHTAHMAMK